MTDLAIRDYTPADFDAVVALWRNAGLTRPWNDPADDIALCLSSGHGAVLLGLANDAIAASVMVGHDGHRGWVYYLAVDRAHARRGHGRRMMEAAERWLAERGLPKIQLMVRAENEAVAAFYRKLGYLDTGTRVFERWLKSPKRPKPGLRRIEIVITYLEMKAPPPPPPPRQPHHQLALLRLAKPSVAFYRYLYGAVGEPWFWYERRMLADEELAALIGAPGIEISVLYADGEPAGYVEMDYRNKADRSESGVNLAYFGLVPRFIGHGLGGFLLGRAVEEAWRRGARRLWVHTCTLDHPRALALYQKAGFVPYKQETKVIDDPRALGLIPATVKLPPAARLVAPK
ncbi:MAG TPA: GNAT family acetyltransferase [Alphaproteobacteria bacterium]|jgi:ribosomal protein S18 acetylase RimI-like enzyme